MATDLSPISVAAPERLEWRSPTDLTPYAGNARTHSRKQIRQIADSISRFGFTNPVLIDADDGIIAGHGRVAAAELLGLAQVPVIRLEHLSPAERRAYILADNRLAELAGWDEALLAIELEALIELDFDLDVTGFEIAEVDALISGQSAEHTSDAPVPVVPEPGPTVTAPGDLWALGDHRLICGDARSADTVAAAMDDTLADLIFTDPPYNVPIDGHVLSKGQHVHREFAFAAGEMDQDAFTTFLTDSFGAARSVARDGAIAFVFMDWRHMREVLAAGDAVFTELKNLCIWNKSNAGMGSFYRSKHELVFVWKIGSARHTNAFGLGETGRYRTNVWDYAGANTLGAERAEALAMHPTVKPVGLIQDAIQDCTRRGDHVLDPFGGSGSTLIAAVRSGRIAHLVEYEPAWCDTMLARYTRETGGMPVHVETGQSWDDRRQGQ